MAEDKDVKQFLERHKNKQNDPLVQEVARLSKENSQQATLLIQRSKVHFGEFLDGLRIFINEAKNGDDAALGLLKTYLATITAATDLVEESEKTKGSPIINLKA